MLGKVLNDRYKIIKKLGSGGMALVFEAQDLLLDRKVAIKMLRPEYVSDKDFIKKFRHEAKAVARISHPNVVSIFDIGQEKENQYLVMEYIEGQNLKDIIKNRGKLTITESLDIANQICAALVVAHKNNIIHCDIKPHNILITPDKQVKVTDFGIARAITSSTATMTDTIMGSAHYFSPEQARGGDIKTYSDLYSVGVVLYEMITGEVPFKGESPISVALQHIQKTPKNPSSINSDIPYQVEELVMKALAKEPEDRFQSAINMRETITSVLKNLRSDKNNSKIIVSDSGDTKVLKKSDFEREKKKNQKREKKSKKREKQYLTEQDESKSKMSKWLVWLVTIILITGIPVAGFFYFYYNYTDVPIVEVPDIVGMSFDEAASVSSQVGLDIEKQNEGVYSPDIPKNNIISQIPTAGERVRQTRTIMVTISKGPMVLNMPDLVNKSLREAEIILDNKNILIGNKKYEYNSQIPKDHIISQTPTPEETLKEDQKVNLVISKGPRPEMVKTPNLIGLDRNEAVSKLNSLGLKLGNVDSKLTKRFKKGQISEQQYQSGTEIPKESTVDLTISNGLINKNNSKIYTSTIFVNVIGNQEVTIVVTDDNGRDVVYNQVHNPGDYVRQTINSVGPSTFKVFIDGKLVKERKIGE